MQFLTSSVAIASTPVFNTWQIMIREVWLHEVKYLQLWQAPKSDQRALKELPKSSQRAPKEPQKALEELPESRITKLGNKLLKICLQKSFVAPT